MKLSVLEFDISNSVDLWAFLEAGSVSFELLNPCRLVRMVLIHIVVGVELVVSITRKLKEASLAGAFLIRLILLM